MEWLCTHKRQIVVLLTLLIVFSTLWVWIKTGHEAEISALRNALTQNEQELRAAKSLTEELHAQLSRKQDEIAQLQRNNDRRVKEVTANAYKKARSLSDDDLLAAYSRLISGARQRNAGRERADTGPEE